MKINVILGGKTIKRVQRVVKLKPVKTHGFVLHIIICRRGERKIYSAIEPITGRIFSRGYSLEELKDKIENVFKRLSVKEVKNLIKKKADGKNLNPHLEA